MNRTKEPSTSFSRIMRAVVIGTIFSTVVCLLLLAIMAAIIAAQDIPSVAIPPMAVIAAAIGAFVGGFVCALISRERGLLWGGLCGLLLYVLILLAGTVWFQDAQPSFWLIKLGILVACGSIGGILGVNLKRR